MRPAKTITDKERRKNAAQRCLCSHRRDVHTYTPLGNATARIPNARPCAVHHCTCDNFLLLQRSIL